MELPVHRNIVYISLALPLLAGAVLRASNLRKRHARLTALSETVIIWCLMKRRGAVILHELELTTSVS